LFKAKDTIWDDDAKIAFHNTFSSQEGKDTFVLILYELGFFNDEVGRNEDGNVTLESAIEGAARRNYATTLLRRLAHDDSDTFSYMLNGLLKNVTPLKKENRDAG
jgi:hypothetical protein